MRTWPPVRPLVGPARHPPSQEISEAPGLRAMDVEEARAVKVIRDRAVVVASYRGPRPEAGRAGSGKGRQGGDQSAARQAHTLGPDWMTDDGEVDLPTARSSCRSRRTPWRWDC